LKREDVLGKRATDVIPGIENDPAGWIETYGKVALTGEPVRFENYSETLKKWYSVSAYSPESGYFAAVFEDISERKNLERLNQASNHINLIVNSTLDFDAIMSRTVREACKAIGAESAAISLRKKDGWSVGYAHGFPREIIGAEITDEEDPHAVLAINTQQIVVVNDAFNDVRVNRERMRNFNIRSVMAIPLVTREEVLGVLFLNHHSAPTAFSKTQTDFAERLGHSLALALENAALLATEKKRRERVQLLSDTASRLLATDTPHAIVDELCRGVMAHLGCDVFFNYIADEQTQRLHLNAFAGIPEESARQMEWLDYGVAVCGCAARDVRRMVAEDIPPAPDPMAELLQCFGVKAGACHPFFSGGRVIGILSVGSRKREVFTEEDLSLVRTFADQVAAALERARLMEALGRSRDELEARVRERTADLARTSELLERVFSSVDISLAYMDRGFNFLRVNRAYAKADEHEPDFFMGKNHFAFFPNEENERIFKRVVDTGEPYSVYAKPFVYVEHPERGVTYWDWNLQPVKEPDGRVGGVVLSLINVTERVRAQEAVRAERQRFNDVLESLPAYVVLLTPDYHARFANRAFRERFGEAGGRRCFEFLFGRSEPCEACETYSVLKTMTPNEWEWTGPDGRIYSVFDFPFTDSDGATLILEMGIDITHRKRAEEELKKKENQIRYFASQCLTAQETERRRMAAELHDGIASSLAGIKFRIEEIAEDMKIGLGSIESLQHLSSSVAQSIGDVRRIMADLRPSILDDLGVLPALNWFCREYEKTYSHISVEKEIRISEGDVPDPLKTAIFRISQEALTNVAKHSSASLVSLSLQKVGERVELTIQDNGLGFQSDVIVKGFGLSTMRERAELSGGTFSTQTVEGKGAIVRATWPLHGGN
jgi:PAS domain S-box-containing protein